MAGAEPVRMPKLGLTMTEGTVVEWLVAPGARFSRGDMLLVVETDKIANDIAAETDGRLIEIVVPAGDTVAVGTVLAQIVNDDAAPADPDAATGSVASVPGPATPAAGAETPPEAGAGNGRVVATPLARRIARESGIDLAHLRGSGPRGRIKAQDVQCAASASSRPEPLPAGAGATDRVVPDGQPVLLSRAQQVAADRTSRSKSVIPHFYLTATVTVDALVSLRAQANATAGWQRTSITHWLVAAIGRALVDVAEARRVWRGNGAVQLAGSSVGVVADVGGELFIPVVADAGKYGVGTIAEILTGLITRAGNGPMRREHVDGAAVSLSNLGMYGVDSVTPVIDPDQGMIIGAGRISRVFRPGANAEPVATSEMVLTLACDHRIHNGVTAARFLGRVVSYLHEPMGMLIPPVASQRT